MNTNNTGFPIERGQTISECPQHESSRILQAQKMQGNGRPQGTIPSKYGESPKEDGRPQGTIPFKYGESPKEDGRPQGAPPRTHPTPVPTIRRCRANSYI